MQNQRNLPIEMQDFTTIRNDGYLYIDKTDLIYASQYLPLTDDAINATVKVEAVGTELIPVKQYYIDFSYNAT